MKRMIVVCGVPRSGTSLVCQGLERLGVSFGGPLIPADTANPWGYYEHRALMELMTAYCLNAFTGPRWFIQERLTLTANPAEERRALVEALKEEARNHELFGWKTPLAGRIDGVGDDAELFSWLCQDADVEPVYVHALRDPSAVYLSTLAANGGKDTSECYSRFLLTWARMVTEIRDLGPACEVWYEDWLEYSPQIVLDKMADALALPRADASGLLKQRET